MPRAFWVPYLVVLMANACAIPEDERCGQHQRFENDVCVCEDGYGLNRSSLRCEPCGPNQVTETNRCVCEAGYDFDPDTGKCLGLLPGQGDACAIDDDCKTAPFTSCHLPGGFCTALGCRSSTECFGSYVCDTSTDPSYCMRPPTGLMAPCLTQADCQGYEASYCEVFQGKACLVRDCVVDPDDCFEGWSCCDIFNSFSVPNICLRDGYCKMPGE